MDRLVVALCAPRAALATKIAKQLAGGVRAAARLVRGLAGVRRASGTVFATAASSWARHNQKSKNLEFFQESFARFGGALASILRSRPAKLRRDTGVSVRHNRGLRSQVQKCWCETLQMTQSADRHCHERRTRCVDRRRCASRPPQRSSACAHRPRRPSRTGQQPVKQRRQSCTIGRQRGVA